MDEAADLGIAAKSDSADAFEVPISDVPELAGRDGAGVSELGTPDDADVSDLNTPERTFVPWLGRRKARLASKLRSIILVQRNTYDARDGSRPTASSAVGRSA